MPELNLRIHNLLERQRRYRQYLQQELILPTNTSDSSLLLWILFWRNSTGNRSQAGRYFFGVEQLAEQLHLSRSHLHRKLKVLVGLPPGMLSATTAFSGLPIICGKD
ncbi:helix-turn-helix transcriptional regulator [Adhaeribacter arboris]|uniref:hypothetical protein n=1 Tax=Adhaeribacter arboris TaxID=2072846 RepID=UPI0011B2278C|nr:hypothetical protein [Adhaeribacter arboris]